MRRSRPAARPGLMPRRRRQVNRGFGGSLLDPMLPVMAPGIEAILHFALVIDGVEGPITERDDDHDRDDRRDIAAPARRRLILLARRGLAHAERLGTRW